jgi:uncharacterized protein YdeI (YjbR/CyaY-like superfamily)
MPDRTETLERAERAERADWRRWLAARRASAREIWLLMRRGRDTAGVVYLDAVEAALGVGWIDGIATCRVDGRVRQRFVAETAAGRMLGNGNDGGRLTEADA